MPALAHIKVPMDPDKRGALLGLHDKPNVAKQLINFMLDMLLLPYGFAIYIFYKFIYRKTKYVKICNWC